MRRAPSSLGGSDLDHPLMALDEPGAESTMTILEELDVAREKARHAINTGELYAPLGWGPLPVRIVASVLLLPFLGTFWMRFALSEKMANRVVGHNPTDWLVVFFVGLAHQCAMVGLVNTLRDTTYNHCYFPTDFYGAVIFYPLSFVYLFAISVTYRLKKDSSRMLATNRKLERIEVTTTKANALSLLEEFRMETSFAMWVIIPLCTLLSFVILIVIRLCIDREECLQADGTVAWTRFAIPMQSMCEGYVNPKYAETPELRLNNVDFNIMNAFWCLLISSAVCCSIYSVILFYQQVRQIEEFTYIQKYSRKRPFLRDVNDFSKDVAVWATVWQELLQGLNNRPICRAFISTNAAVSFLLWVASSFYIVFQTVFRDFEVGELTTASSALLGFNTITLAAFIYIAVRMQQTIEYQVRSVSAAQNDLQRQIDENKGSMERDVMLQKMSNCRVLAALDVYLTVFDNTPKIIGTISLESMRWIALLGGLFAMNVFFFSLYLSKCAAPTAPDG